MFPNAFKPAVLATLCLGSVASPAEARQMVLGIDGSASGAPPVETGLDVDDKPTPIVGNAVTLEGRLFYNDLREAGRFDLHRYPDRRVGAKSGSRDPGTANFLSARGVVADIYEVDDPTFLNANCKRLDLLGSAAVQGDGSFAFTTTHVDSCRKDTSTLRLAVQFRLRFCNGPDADGADRCLAVRTAGNDLYTLWHGDAEPDGPFLATAGINTLADALFQTSPTDGDRADIPAQAANMYASLFEAAKAWHIDNPIPFAYEAYGEVTLKFPAEGQDSCKTHSASEIRCLIVSDDGWVTGDGPGHEYGHVVQRRAWDGTTGPCGDCPGGLYERDGNDSWSAVEREYPNAAFKEGWANFAGRVANDSCTGRFDDNGGNAQILPVSGGPAPIAPQDGKSYPRNVTKLLCDWYDTAGDDDGDRSGAGDHFAADLHSVWTNMKNMFATATQAEIDAGLNVCDYIDYYVYNRKGPSAAGQDEHDRYRSLIADLAYNNGIACGLPEPGVPSVPHSVAAEITNWTIIRSNGPLDAVGRKSEVAIRLSWQDASWNEEEFVIEASGAGIGNVSQWQEVGTVARNKKRFLDEFTVGSWLPPLGDRCYRVRARNDLGDSGVEGTTCMTLAVPAAPTDLAGWMRRRDVPVVGGGTVPIYEVSLSWTDRSNNEATFEIEKSANGAGFQLVTVTGPGDSEALVAGVPDETACFRVKGRNTFGASPTSNEICLAS